MSLTWLAPAAWWLAALAAVPIAMHLLARHRRQPLRFPTVRFLEDAPAATRRRWQLHEPGLLAVRVSVVLASRPCATSAASRQSRSSVPTLRALAKRLSKCCDSAMSCGGAARGEGDSRRARTSAGACT